jgi:hypothetical protein
MTKNWKKLQFTYPFAYINDVQATGEVFSPQKITSNTSKHEISLTYFYFCRAFLPSWIWIWIRIQPTKINADPCGKINTGINREKFTQLETTLSKSVFT